MKDLRDSAPGSLCQGLAVRKDLFRELEVLIVQGGRSKEDEEGMVGDGWEK